MVFQCDLLSLSGMEDYCPASDHGRVDLADEGEDDVCVRVECPVFLDYTSVLRA